MEPTGLVRMVALASIVAMGGCFPDYSTAPAGSSGGAGGTGGTGASGAAGLGGGGSGGGGAGASGASGSAGLGGGGEAGGGGSAGADEDMTTIEVPEGVFAVRAQDVATGTTLDGSVELTRDFDVDIYEVTVGQFLAWDRTPPCDEGTCTLDPGGPYEGEMQWDSTWNLYLDPHGVSASDCYSPYQPGGRTTWEVANQDERPDLPMTCVNWYEAVAFCASEGKRLLTHVEWMHVATGGQPLWEYPWGDNPPDDCEMAIWHADDGFCEFPIEVGSAPAGQTEDGVFDMVGSVFEWAWDAPWTVAPAAASDWTGPEPMPGSLRTRKGGAYIVPEFEGDERLRNDAFESFPADQYYSDAGFRCARTVPQ